MKESRKNNNQEKGVGVFQFTVHYIKLDVDNVEENNGIMAEKGFRRPISVLAENFEDARNQALEDAQALLRELKDDNWYMRLMND
jgi:hypothetical protein